MTEIERLDDPAEAAEEIQDYALPDPFGIYLNDIGSRSRRLTRDEETDLGKRIEAGLAADAILSGKFEGTVEATSEELEQLAVDGQFAKDELIENNTKLVVSVARKFGGSALSIADKVQEGNFGLIHAAEKFDYTKGYKFATYARSWINQAIRRGIANTERTIRMPVHAGDDLRKVLSTIGRVQEDGGDVSDRNIACITGFSEKKVAGLRTVYAQQTCDTLERPFDRQGDSATLGDMIPAVGPDGNLEEVVVRHEADATLNRALHQLTPREHSMFLDKFGGPKKVADASIAEKYGVSRETVRRDIKSALNKLRGSLPDNLYS